MSVCDAYPNIWMSHIIEDVLRHMTYEQISQKRLVDSTWHSLCTKVINTGCFELSRKFEESFKYLDKIHSEHKFFDVTRFSTYYFQHLLDQTRSYLELIQSEFNLTLACVGRYYSNHENICLFDSRLLDHTAWLISRLYKYPWHELGKDKTLYDSALERCHSDFYRQLCYQCQLRFNCHVERPLNQNETVSGAKLIDILDALLERPTCAVKTVHSLEYCKDTKLITYQATYTLYNAWFSRARNEEETDATSWTFNNFHYFLYIRLIRLVRYHNRFTLEAIHKDRMCCSEFGDDDRSPTGIKFSGNGDTGGYYYYYGCCNDKMKSIKFRHDRSPPEIRLDLKVSLTSTYLLASMKIQEYLRTNFRDLDYERRSLQLRLDVHNTYSMYHRTPEEWSLQIP